jgi:indolepyruvate ferredoxin oxidoreductase
MTGGQPVDGGTSVDAIARQVESEGVAQVVVLSDDIGKYAAIKGRFPAGTEFHERHALDEVQRRLRQIPGVTVLIYEQTCAAEKRRRRKKGELADPPKRLFINDAVCEGCGDCSMQSNCVAVLPHETSLGRKRRIDQSACNKDYRCLDGFCPSFVSVTGGKPRRHSGLLDSQREAFLQRVQALPLPPAIEGPGPYDLLVTGVGGTGVVTVGALITMAAHLEGLHASVLDFMGFAQKGGAVMSFVRVAREEAMLNQARIDAQQCDAVLACDLVVAAAPEALQTMSRGRTRVLANTHPTPVAESVRKPDAQLHVPALLAKLQFAVGAERVQTFDAQALALDFLGDTMTANIVALGYAWQRGLVPVGLAALRRAIELNGVAVATNHLAFALGRLAAAQPQALAALREPGAAGGDGGAEELPALLERARVLLTAWGNRAWAERFARTLQGAQERERALGSDDALPFTKAVAKSLLKLMSYKDEYEVARLFTNGDFRRALHDQFEGELKIRFHMAPPLLARARHGKPPQKMSFGPWLMPLLKVLARGKALRGSVLDPFGHSAERRMERQLIIDFEARVAELQQGLSAERLALATAIAEVPQLVRGYGHVKRANLAIARAREAELLHRWDPSRYPQPTPPARKARAEEKAVMTG